MSRKAYITMIAGLAVIAVAAWTLGYIQTQQRAGGDRVGGGQEFNGWLAEPAVPAPDFELADQDGRPFRLSEHLGNAVVLFFGYTTCPDVCPTTLADFRDVKRALGPEAAADVDFVFITVDPARDTPERLKQYIANFDESFYALTGSEEQLRKVWSDYGVRVERVDDPQNPGNYWMNHGSLSYVVDTKGILRLAYPFGMGEDAMVADLRKIVAERG